ncbi:MAG: LLM class flavin-dependent oxidoreductase, partial [Actinobacteria bacterium]|nr:LLM class flavin-dependent oxidoreductase [Actinomycetota bacterium]
MRRCWRCVESHAVRTLDSGDPWRSEFFDIPDNLVDPPCVQKPHPPILGGGTSKTGIKRAANVCDGWFSLPMETLPVVKALADSYREQCSAAGVTPYICLMRET